LLFATLWADARTIANRLVAPVDAERFARSS
jgi:hypothetical protein